MIQRIPEPIFNNLDKAVRNDLPQAALLHTCLHILLLLRIMEIHKVTVLLDTQTAELFSEYCRQRGFKKSTLILRLIREHLSAESFALQPNLPALTNQKFDEKKDA